MDNDGRYEVKLEKFEGPMDLLIFLIKKAEIDIYDIPISVITEQFLSYIQLMQSLNINIAGDFLVMAATLANIKSKMLLPVVKDDDDDEVIDPRDEITKPLIEYMQMKDAACQLANKNILGDTTFTRDIDFKNFMTCDEDEVIKVGLFELMDSFQKILSKVSKDHQIDFSAEKFSIKDKIAELIDMLEEKQTVEFGKLFNKDTTKSEIITTFLAILEMMKLNLIKAIQHLKTNEIQIYYL